MPTPEDMGLAPAWDNYLVAQAVQASLGLVPREALGIFIAISDTSVELEFQLTDLTDANGVDMADIVDNFTTLIGFVVPVSATHRIVEHREPTSPGDRVRWIFSGRTD